MSWEEFFNVVDGKALVVGGRKDNVEGGGHVHDACPDELRPLMPNILKDVVLSHKINNINLDLGNHIFLKEAKNTPEASMMARHDQSLCLSIPRG